MAELVRGNMNRRHDDPSFGDLQQPDVIAKVSAGCNSGFTRTVAQEG